eukprot:2922870-Prymnesium_polylepis.1
MEAGAAIDAVNDRSETALLLACLSGHEECSRLLLQHGAAATHTVSSGFTPLMLAAQNGHDHCLRALIEKGAA